MASFETSPAIRFTNFHWCSGKLQEGLDRLESYLSRLDQVVESYKKTHPNQVFAGDNHGYAIFKKKHKALMRAESGKKGTFYLHPNAAGSKVLAKVGNCVDDSANVCRMLKGL